MASLWASTRDRERLSDAESAVLLIGGYDGSGNYGDVLQLATAVETLRRLPGEPLPVPVVERETHGHHSELMRRYGERFEPAAFAFFEEEPGDWEDDLVELAPGELRTPRALLYIYGGGRIGVAGSAADAPAAIEALRDGTTRAALLDHLQTRAREVAARFDRGRATLSLALAEGLKISAASSQLEAERQRADAAEQELRAVRATRGWQLLERLRALRSGRRARPAPSAPPPPPAATPPPADVPAELRDEIAHIKDLVAEARGRGDYALEVARDMSLPTKMLAFMSWLELHPVTAGPRLSVVLATRDRPRLLARAIPSVIAQRYRDWQLVVVDDGTDPDTRAVVEGFEDDRLTLVAGPRCGLGAARNAGLDRAKGEIVCYLDDDNVMHPSWLQAVAHVFTERDDVDVAYGISLAEHRIPDDLGEQGWWPSFWQLPWSRQQLLEENVTDAGSLAHRRGLVEARFDERLSTGEDWDLLLRLTADRDALAIPALSHAYAMAGADRMSRDPQHRAGLKEIRRRHRDA